MTRREEFLKIFEPAEKALEEILKAEDRSKYEKLRQTALLLIDYIGVISGDLDETAPIAHLRGWRSTRVEEGRRIRAALGIQDEEKNDV
jgi:hypothetical protein